MAEALKKILICDDHPIVHAGIKYTLKELFPEAHFEFECVMRGAEALLKIEDSLPDILFLDLRLPDISGFEVLKRLEKRKMAVKIIILTGEDGLATILQLSRVKISAILLKSYSNRSFKEAFEHLARNENSIYLDSKLEQNLKNEVDKKQLSLREFEILSLLVKGYSNKTIAQSLKCSPETIKTHLTSIGRKTNIDDRDNLISWFYEGRET